MTVGEKIQHYRKAKGLTQSELAGILGVNHMLLSRYETDKLVPPPMRLVDLAEALGVSPLVIIDFMPCMVGETVWFIAEKSGRKGTHYEVREGIVDNITFGGSMIPQIAVCDKNNIWYYFDTEKHFGKVLFLERKAAQTMLENTDKFADKPSDATSEERHEFEIMGQKFYNGLRYEELNERFMEKTELFDFLPNDKDLLIEKAEICGVPAKVKITFNNEVLTGIVITAEHDYFVSTKDLHRKILKRFFGEPNCRKSNANVCYEYPDLTAGDYISVKNGCFINIVFNNKTDKEES